MSDDIKERFLEQYGGIEFKNVKFRPGQAFTVDFGFDNTFDEFRIHNAIDRGNKGTEPGANPIYAPFDCYATWIPEADGGFGSQLILLTEYGFEIRIAHMEDVEPMVKDSLAMNAAGALLGYAGTKGKSTGIHTHTEIVSTGTTATNEMLNSILFEKYGSAIYNFYGITEAVAYIREHNVAKDLANPEAAYAREIKKRAIKNLNNFACVRNDYKDGKLRTFYNSQKLFGF